MSSPLWSRGPAMGSPLSVVWAAWHLGRLGPRHPGIEFAVPHLSELLNDNDPSVCAEALVALENLSGKGAPPAELKSLSAHR
jgi:Armadillo/beta-catenin-like repeat-containing protein